MHHGTPWRPVHRSPATRLSLAVLAIVLVCDTAEAGLFYDFEQRGTGTVLATLELASLSATHTEVLSLEFSPEGEAIISPYGLGLFKLG